MLLDEFFNYKNELMKTLCSNAKIVELITDSKSAAVPNYDLAYSQVFPYEFIPETIDEGKTFVCFDVDIIGVDNKIYYTPVVYVWLFTHKSKMRMSGGGVRTDKLSVEINKELSGSRYFGLGELNLQSVGRFSPIDDYQGRVLTYYAKDFNRPSPSKRPPAIRKNVG